MSQKIPRGIQEVEWKTKDGEKRLKYRVRIVRKDIKTDKVFETLKEAKDFLFSSKTESGKQQIISQTKEFEQEENLKYIEELAKNPAFSYYVKKYINDYVDTLEIDTELKRRNYNNIKSFYKTIQSTYIDFKDSSKTGIFYHEENSNKRLFVSLKPKEITGIEINEYIKSRLKTGVKKSSVSRELTYISKVFNKLKFIEKQFFDIRNPTYEFDKELLKETKIKHVKRISEELQDNIFKALDKKQNKELKHIVVLSLLTSMRRSEIITLRSEQIKDKYIQLDVTKNKKQRRVILTKEAKEYIQNNIDLNKDKLFSYTIGGFESSFKAFLKQNKFSSISFHMFRKESISRFIEKIGSQNSILITELLGISSIKKFEENYVNSEDISEINTQEKLLKSTGHSNAQVTKDHYFNLKD